MNLSHERLSTDGLFLLENGHDLFMWVGRSLSPSILNTLFGVTALEPGTELRLLDDSSDYCARVQAVIDALRADRYTSCTAPLL